MTKQTTRRDMIKGSVALAGLGVLGLPEWAFPALVHGEKLMELIQKGHNKINSIYLLDIGCALGVHAGPGSLAVAIQTF